jgi:hypothetical protein
VASIRLTVLRGHSVECSDVESAIAYPKATRNGPATELWPKEPRVMQRLQYCSPTAPGWFSGNLS